MLHLKAPAKINLFLRILQRRTDGYHEIETLFQRIGLCDQLTFETTPGNRGDIQLQIKGRGDWSELEGPNLISKAWKTLSVESGKKGQAVNVILEKNIPLGGGLGGGSSNAACALSAFRELAAPDVEVPLLHKVARGLGADVPFFLGPPAAVGRGVGENLTPVKHGSAFWVCLAFPPFGVSTRDAYLCYNPDNAQEAGDLNGLVQALEAGDLPNCLPRLFNEMEELAFSIRPDLGEMRQALEKSAKQPVRMSGSGSTLFTLFASEEEAAAMAQKWNRDFSVEALASPFLIG